MPAVPVELPSPWGTLRTEIDVPDGDVEPAALAPAMRALSNAIVAHVHAALRPQVSCRAGCGACCRQMVPLAEPELHALAALVAAMPEDRRRAVEARFAETRLALDRAGLTPRLLAPPTDRTEQRALSHDYLRAGIPCPFLVDESCSIHADRPTICREYSVTSPAAHCSNPWERHVTVVPVPAWVGALVALAIDEVLAESAGADPGPSAADAPAPPRLRTKITPLPLALDWVAAHPHRLGRLPARRVMVRTVTFLGETLATLCALSAAAGAVAAAEPPPGSPPTPTTCV